MVVPNIRRAPTRACATGTSRIGRVLPHKKQQAYLSGTASTFAKLWLQLFGKVHTKFIEVCGVQNLKIMDRLQKSSTSLGCLRSQDNSQRRLPSSFLSLISTEPTKWVKKKLTINQDLHFRTQISYKLGGKTLKDPYCFVNTSCL